MKLPYILIWEKWLKGDCQDCRDKGVCVEKLRRVIVGFPPLSRYNNCIEGNCEGAEKV